MASRSFGSKKPSKALKAKELILAEEIKDLRNDIEDAFTSLEDEVDTGDTALTTFKADLVSTAAEGTKGSDLVGVSTLGGKVTAGTLTEVLTEIHDNAASASTAAGAAQDTANQAVADAATADGKAVDAQADATQALADAATADGKAVAAQADATQALADAATADGKAVAAQARATANVATATTTPYTIGSAQEYVFSNPSADEAITINLPLCADHEKKHIYIKDSKGNAGTRNITVHPNAADTIDGAGADVVIAAHNGYLELVGTGTTWFSIDKQIV